MERLGKKEMARNLRYAPALSQATQNQSLNLEERRMINDSRPVLRIIYIIIALLTGLAIAQLVIDRTPPAPCESLIERAR